MDRELEGLQPVTVEAGIEDPLQRLLVGQVLAGGAEDGADGVAVVSSARAV